MMEQAFDSGNIPRESRRTIRHIVNLMLADTSLGKNKMNCYQVLLSNVFCNKVVMSNYPVKMCVVLV